MAEDVVPSSAAILLSLWPCARKISSCSTAAGDHENRDIDARPTQHTTDASSSKHGQAQASGVRGAAWCASPERVGPTRGCLGSLLDRLNPQQASRCTNARRFVGATFPRQPGGSACKLVHGPLARACPEGQCMAARHRSRPTGHEHRSSPFIQVSSSWNAALQLYPVAHKRP